MRFGGFGATTFNSVWSVWLGTSSPALPDFLLRRRVKFGTEFNLTLLIWRSYQLATDEVPWPKAQGPILILRALTETQSNSLPGEQRLVNCDQFAPISVTPAKAGVGLDS
jgi:hypothetical protein